MELNKYLDSTYLKSDATKKDILNLCNDALINDYASVCVNPYYVSYAKEILAASNVLVCTVIGFPLGMNKKETKVFEVKNAILDGADEIDMVINIGALKDGKYDYVESEIKEVLESASGRVVKVIIETCYLTDEEIKKITSICNKTHTHFIKTSTGYGSRGASVHDIELINEVKSDMLEIKASGGIKTLDDVNKFVDLGVSRIGTSNASKIMEEWK